MLITTMNDDNESGKTAPKKRILIITSIKLISVIIMTNIVIIMKMIVIITQGY